MFKKNPIQVDRGQRIKSFCVEMARYIVGSIQKSIEAKLQKASQGGPGENKVTWAYALIFVPKCSKRVSSPCAQQCALRFTLSSLVTWHETLVQNVPDHLETKQ